MIYSLLKLFAPYLDRHLLFPILDFLQCTDLYTEREISKYNLELLKGTHMADMAINIYEQLYPGEDIPEDMIEARKTVIDKYTIMNNQLTRFLEIVKSEEIPPSEQQSRENITWTQLKEKYHFDDSILQKLYEFARLTYSSGIYKTAVMSLEIYGNLISANDENLQSFLWGKLACNILLKNYDEAINDIKRINEYIDKLPIVDVSASEILYQRTWLIHWSLFVFLKNRDAQEEMLMFLLKDKVYLSAIFTTCPYVFRYVAAAALIYNDRKSFLDEVLICIEEEPPCSVYDPIIGFIRSICIDFDFVEAQCKLKDCKTFISTDFFLNPFLEEFINCARSMMFETFCRLHHCIEIDLLAEQLNVSTSEAELYILNLIKEGRLDARIDCEKGNVMIEFDSVSPYQTITDKSKALLTKLEGFTISLERKTKSADGTVGFGKMNF